MVFSLDLALLRCWSIVSHNAAIHNALTLFPLMVTGVPLIHNERNGEVSPLAGDGELLVLNVTGLKSGLELGCCALGSSLAIGDDGSFVRSVVLLLEVGLSSFKSSAGDKVALPKPWLFPLGFLVPVLL